MSIEQWAWTNRHDWDYSPMVMLSSPPKYEGTCRRCGTKKTGWLEVFQTNDCPGRVIETEVKSEHLHQGI